MRGEGAMPVIEAAYRLDLDDKSWLLEMARIASDALGDPGMIRAGAIFRSHDRGFTHEVRVFEPHDDDFIRAVDSMESMVPRKINAQKYRNTRCATGSELALAHGLPAQIATMLIGYKLGRWGVHDVLQVQGGVLDDLSVGLTASLRQGKRILPRVRHTWERVGVHMAAGLRLRRSLGDPKVVLERASLVLERSGAIAHADAEVAADKTLADKLRECARAVDHARGSVSRDAPEQAVELWRGLFEGRWTILETFDTDGRAYVVACENEPDVADTRALTRRERQVAELAAKGHGDEFIAYTLGLSVPTVQTHLRRALAKMGLASRTQLVRAAATLKDRLDRDPA